MKLKHILIAIGVIIVLLIGAKMAGLIGGETVEKVTIDKVTEREVIETVTASGKIQPATEVKLSSEVSGEVTELLVKEGDVVKKGQLLIKVRPDVLKSGYDRATASYSSQKASVAASEQQLVLAKGTFASAETTFKRNKELFDKKVISASEFEAAQNAYLTAKTGLESARQNVIGSKFGLEQSGANVQEASANLAKATIFAPVNGVISKLNVELGDRILGTAQMAGTEIMRISNLTNMEVNVDVNENDINRVKIGDKSSIEVDAFRDKKFIGYVTEIASSSTAVGTASASSVDQVTNFTVKVRLESDENQKSPFRPGLSATVDIQSETVKGLSIPIQSVFVDDVKSKDGKMGAPAQDEQKQKAKLTDKKVKQYVYTYSNGVVKKKEITTGIQNDQFIIVKSGLKAGEEIVTGPYSAIQTKLKDGMKVEKTSKEELFKETKK